MKNHLIKLENSLIRVGKSFNKSWEIEEFKDRLDIGIV